jgi:hypothetical protein
MGDVRLGSIPINRESVLVTIALTVRRGTTKKSYQCKGCYPLRHDRLLVKMSVFVHRYRTYLQPPP